MSRFSALRPHNWTESIADTLDAIQSEAEHHYTEQAVSQVTGEWPSQVDFAVSMLRARAVVLAEKVEFLQAALKVMQGQLATLATMRSQQR